MDKPLEELIREELRRLHFEHSDRLLPESYLRRDCLFNGWYLQKRTKESKKTLPLIDFQTWVDLSTSDTGGLKTAIADWYGLGFFRDDEKVSIARGEYAFTSEAMDAIEKVFGEREFGYCIQAALPGIGLTGLQLFEAFNLLPKDSLSKEQAKQHSLNLSEQISTSIAHILKDEVFWRPIASMFPEIFICELSGNDWRFWLASTASEATLKLNQYIHIAFPLLEALTKDLAAFVLMVFPSVNDTESISRLIEDNPRVFGMTELSMIQFLNLLHLAKEEGRVNKPLIRMFNKKNVKTFDYPPFFAINQLA